MARREMGRKSSGRSSGRRRPKGEGTVFFSESDGRWHARITVEDTLEPTGKRRISVAAQTESEVRQKLADKIAEAKSGVASAGGPTFGAFLDRWLIDHEDEVKPSTFSVRKGHAENWLRPRLGRKGLRELKVADIEKVMDDVVMAGKSPRTANHVRATARVVLQDAERRDLVLTNVAKSARAKRVTESEKVTLNGAQVRCLLDRALQSHWGPLWAFLHTTGLRVGEAIALDWEDLNLVTGHVTVTKNWAKAKGGGWEVTSTKTQRSRRSVPLMRAIVEMLKAHGENVGVQGPVFPDDSGVRPKPYNLKWWWEQAKKACGLPEGARVHDARHTAASLWLNNGLPITTVSRLLGHASLNITLSTYGHLDKATLGVSVDSMERALGLE